MEMLVAISLWLAAWTVGSCIVGALAVYFLTAARRQERSNIYPFPSGSIHRDDDGLMQ